MKEYVICNKAKQKNCPVNSIKFECYHFGKHIKNADCEMDTCETEKGHIIKNLKCIERLKK